MRFRGHDCTGDAVAELTDGSSPGDWRQPTISELCSLGAVVGICPSEKAWNSLIDSSLAGSPKVVNAAGDAPWAEDDAFVEVQASGYWSKTEKVAGSSAWVAYLHSAYVDSSGHLDGFYVWPVRGGQ